MITPNGVLELLESHERAFSLPSPLYSDATAFELDLDGILQRHWLFAGPSCQIREPGEYFTVLVGRTSVIVLRDRQGVLRAFYNTCRHRGSRICTADQGRLTTIVCPYHKWTYDLTGALRFTGRMHQGFDPANYGLIPVHLETVGGLIYICLAAEAPDFSDYKATLEPYLAPHDLAHAKLAHVDSITVRGNWKLVMENSRECFHCATGHPELARSFITEYDSGYPQSIAGVEDFWRRCESLGLRSVDTAGEHEDFRINRLPLGKGAQSITMDGKPAVARLLGKVADGDIGSLRWAHFPSTFNHVLGDYSFHYRMLPTAPEETLVTAYWLVDAEAVEGRDYRLDNLIKVWDETNRQDAILVERNQLGVNSAGYRVGPYSQEAELGVIAFVEWYCRKMIAFLGGGQRRIARVV
jgi:phenylpropionate dioxygenase-like ring-hydroxylating dioxygenase large terminal subunit